jgi:hypothetical protein
MTIQRRTTLEDILGMQLEQVTWADLRKLIEDRVEEIQDLEFKGQHYDFDEKGKREAAKDVAAFANTTGGVIIIGLTQDDQGIADSLNPVSLEEDQIQRYHQIVASRVKPLALLRIIPVIHSESPPQGALLLVIDRSMSAPHATTVNEGLVYPKRHGRMTINLLEHEVAAGYRERAQLVQSRISLAADREREFLDCLDPSNLWFVMSLVPDFPGEVKLDASTFQDYNQKFAGKLAAVPWYALTFSQVRARHRRIFASDFDAPDSGQQKWCAMELHTDGSGCYAARLGTYPQRMALENGMNERQVISDEALANCILSGLEKLGNHSWNSSAQGLANIRVQIWKVDKEKPISLGHDLAFHGFGAGESFSKFHPCEVSVPLEDLKKLGGSLIRAAAVMMQEVTQSLGVIQSNFFREDGKLVLNDWSLSSRGLINSWSSSNGIELG